MAIITLIGALNYDKTLFDNLTLPDGIDKNTFVDSLVLRAGEFPILYSDLDFFKDAITVWGKKWYPTFTKWLEGLKAEWNPIENYDRYEEYHDIDNRKIKSDITGTNNFKGTNKDKSEGKTSAYDSSTYQPKDLNTNEGESTSDTTTTNKNESNDDYTSDRTGHIHGNIGVTQASDMLKAYYDIATWNLYDHMNDLFISEFLLLIY